MSLDKQLDAFFRRCFYYILNIEEDALSWISNGKLSLTEIHVIEAVFTLKEKGENNFSSVAKLLGITLGTLTTSFSKLEKKGYLTKVRDKNDKRVFYINPTPLAEFINAEHSKFHGKLIHNVTDQLDQNEQDNLKAALEKLVDYFENIRNSKNSS